MACSGYVEIRRERNDFWGSRRRQSFTAEQLAAGTVLAGQLKTFTWTYTESERLYQEGVWYMW